MPVSINAKGVIVGNLFSQSNGGFLRLPDQTIVTFDVPGAARTLPQSIDASGSITGYYSS